MDPCFHVFYAKLLAYHLNVVTGVAPSVVFCCHSPSATGFNVSRDALWQNLVVTSSYLSYCIPNQSGHSPLTSSVNTELPFTGYLLFF